MRQPFCILSVFGDVLDDGELHFVGATETLGAARRRIKALAKSSPGQYVIYNGQTGERMPIVAGETRTFVLEGRFGKHTPQNNLTPCRSCRKDSTRSGCDKRKPFVGAI